MRGSVRMGKGGKTGRRGKTALLSLESSLEPPSELPRCLVRSALRVMAIPLLHEGRSLRDCSPSKKPAHSLSMLWQGTGGSVRPPLLSKRASPVMTGIRLSPVSCPLPWGPWNWILPWDPYSFATPRVTPWRRWGSGALRGFLTSARSPLWRPARMESVD